MVERERTLIRNLIEGLVGREREREETLTYDRRPRDYPRQSK